jgi:hypothetical protein
LFLIYFIKIMHVDNATSDYVNQLYWLVQTTPEIEAELHVCNF